MIALITYSDNPLWIRITGVSVKKYKILSSFIFRCEDDGVDDDDVNGENYENN